LVRNESISPTLFEGLRVIEISGVVGQQCGKLFADMGGDVVKVEPPGGDPSRKIGPFVNNTPHPEQSLSFWHYNTNKRSVTLDFSTPQGQNIFMNLVRTAEVVIEDTAPGTLDSLGLGYHELTAVKSNIIMASITPFGQTGPYKDFKTSDLVSLALGGPLWSCGYDDHTIPPIRPYADAAYHIASHYAYIGILAALMQRQMTGLGQYIDVSMHEACHDTTEGAMPIYYFTNQQVRRQTARHASPRPTEPVVFPTADEKWIFTRVPAQPQGFQKLIQWMDQVGMAEDLNDDKYEDPLVRQQESAHITEVVRKFCAAHNAEELYHGAQQREMVWASVRAPDENLSDRHLIERKFFVPVAHPELGKTFDYSGPPYRFSETPWRISRRAPLVGEHNNEIFCDEIGIERNNLVRLIQDGVV